VGGKSHVIPANTIIIINTSATHRNPRYWPSGKGQEHEGKPYAISSFNPLQWLTEGGKFLSPPSGSYIPFSDGLRGCIGLKFATVELCVTLARIMAEYSVELDVDSFDGIDRNLGSEAQWTQARKKAEFELSGGVTFNMTLRLTGKVPISLVLRGQEKYSKFE
jgi:cytochrome P450